MSIEDRDWYREEFKEKQGRAGNSEWSKKENKPQKNNKTINEFLAGERTEHAQNERVRDSHYNPKEFRRDATSERLAVKPTPTVSAVGAAYICIFFMFLTFSATMLTLAVKPDILNPSYQIALKVVDVILALKM